MSKLTIIAAVAAPLVAIAGTLEVPSVKFADGIAMPRFGIGTYAQGSNEICSNSVSIALKGGDAIPRPADEPWQPMHFIR